MSDETHKANETTNAKDPQRKDAPGKAGGRPRLLARVSEAWRDTVGGFAAGEGETANLFSRLADFGTLTQQEAKKLVADTRGRIEANKAEIDRRIEASVKSATKRLSVPNESEIDAFEKELDALDARLDAALAKQA